jgi:hypothetical protein
MGPVRNVRCGNPEPRTSQMGIEVIAAIPACPVRPIFGLPRCDKKLRPPSITGTSRIRRAPFEVKLLGLFPSH